MATYLAERSAHPRSIGLESQLPKHDVPGLTVAEFERHFLGGAKIPVLRSNVRIGLEELRDTLLVPGVHRPVQRGEAVITRDVRIGALLEEDVRRDLVALVHSPMQRRVAHAVALVDLRLRLAKHVQQSPVVGRMRDGVQAAVALYVEYAWVRALLEEQVDDVHEAVTRGPL